MSALYEKEGEEAIALLADLLDPIAKIAGNKEFMEAREKKLPKLALVQIGMKQNAKEIKEILAICDGVAPEAYKKNAIQIATDFLKVLNNEEIMSLFS